MSYEEEDGDSEISDDLPPSRTIASLNKKGGNLQRKDNLVGRR